MFLSIVLCDVSILFIYKVRIYIYKRTVCMQIKFIHMRMCIHVYIYKKRQTDIQIYMAPWRYKYMNTKYMHKYDK